MTDAPGKYCAMMAFKRRSCIARLIAESMNVMSELDQLDCDPK
jgi:hypothetical protein